MGWARPVFASCSDIETNKSLPGPGDACHETNDLLAIDAGRVGQLLNPHRRPSKILRSCV